MNRLETMGDRLIRPSNPLVRDLQCINTFKELSPVLQCTVYIFFAFSASVNIPRAAFHDSTQFKALWTCYYLEELCVADPYYLITLKELVLGIELHFFMAQGNDRAPTEDTDSTYTLLNFSMVETAHFSAEG